MKTKLITSLFFAALLFSCSDDESPYTCETCESTPEAVASNDASGKGIYKGLVVGSSGTIKINISNTGSTISATLTFNGTTYQLTTTATYSNGFEGIFSSGNVSFGFRVNNNGTDFTIFNLVIPGHEGARIELFKEKSTQLVKTYEGTFGGGANGIFNMVVRDNEWLIVAKENGKDYSTAFYGTLSGNSLSGCSNCPGNLVLAGTIGGDEASGNWNDGSKSGTWNGRRTL